jgi:hypothetical protein
MKAGKKTSVTPAFNWKATLAIFIIAIAGLFAVNEYFKYESNLPDDQTGDVILIINVTITINFLNASQEQEGNCSISKVNPSVFDMLFQHFALTYTSYQNGYLITSINGASGGWVYNVEGISPGVGSNLYPASNHSVVVWTQVS